jgi:hypothetical protein
MTQQERGQSFGQNTDLSTRETVRLKNNSLIAEMFMALEHGLERGGEPAISKYYN